MKTPPESPGESTMTSVGADSGRPVTARHTGRRWLRRIGTLLGVVCLMAVLIGYREDLGTVARQVSWPWLTAAIALGGIAYGVLCLLLSTAWWRLLGPTDARPRWIVGLIIWGSAQWAKYLPSNTLHFVGRQMLGRRHGLRQANLALSSTLETLSLVLAAALVAGCGRALEGTLGGREVQLALVGLVGALVALLVLEYILRRSGWSASAMRGVPSLRDAATYRRLGFSTFLHAAFFVGMGGLGWLLFAVVLPADLVAAGGEDPGSMFRVLWVFASAWLAGTVTLGAPAGVGVREGVLVLGLSGSLGGPAAVAVAIMLRAITVTGDGLVALTALLVSSRRSIAATETRDGAQG